MAAKLAGLPTLGEYAWAGLGRYLLDPHYPKSGAETAAPGPAKENWGEALLDGQAAIPGTGLKGMIRASLSPLLYAPMEKVQDRTFSNRPNLGMARNHARLAHRAAIVETLDGDGLPTVVKVLPENISESISA